MNPNQANPILGGGYLPYVLAAIFIFLVWRLSK